MAWVERRVTRTTQPQDACWVDWHNPITRGLREFVTGRRFSDFGNAVVATQGGLSALNTSTYQPVNSPANEVTIFQSAVFDSISNVSSLGVSSGGDSGLGFKNNTTSLRLFKYRASGTANTQSVSTKSLVVGRRVNVCGTFDGATQRLYEDGVLSSSTANAESVFWGESPKLRLGGFSVSNFAGTASILAYFARALSDAEIKSLSENPWQIFEPEVQRVWVDDFVPLPPPPTGGRYIERRVTRTTQPQDACGVDWNNPITQGLIAVYTPKSYPLGGASKLNNETAQTKGVDRYGSMFGTHPNPASASSLPFRTNSTQLTYLIDCTETSASNGHLMGNCAPNYGINTGASLIRGANYSAVMTTTGGIVTTATSPNSRQLNVRMLLAARVRFNGTNYTISLFENGVNVAESSGGFTPSATNLVSICGNIADFYFGTSNLVVRGVNAFNRALSDAEVKSLSENPWQIFEPEVQRVWVDEFVSAGGGVTLAPPLFTETSTFYSPTVSAGSVNLVPSLLTNSPALYSPAISTGGLNLVPPLHTNVSTLYSPTAATGAISVTTPLLTNSSTLHSPNLTAGSVTLVPGLLTNSSSFYSPTASVGAIAVTPALHTNSSSFYSPIISQGSVVLAPSLHTNTSEFFSPEMNFGAVELVAPLLPSANAFFVHSVTTGANLVVPLHTNSSALYSPSLAVGAVTLAPPLLPSANAFFVHSVSVGGDVNLAPPLLGNTSNLYAPSVGAASIYPPPSAVLYGAWYGPTGMEFMGTLIPHAMTPTILGPTEVVAFWPETTVVAFDQPIVVTMVPNT